MKNSLEPYLRAKITNIPFELLKVGTVISKSITRFWGQIAMFKRKKAKKLSTIFLGSRK